MRSCFLNLGFIILSFCTPAQVHAHGVAPHRPAAKPALVHTASTAPRPKPEKTTPAPAVPREETCRLLADKYDRANQFLKNGMAEASLKQLGPIADEALPPPGKGRVSDVIERLKTSLTGYRVIYLRGLAQHDCPQLSVQVPAEGP